MRRRRATVAALGCGLAWAGGIACAPALAQQTIGKVRLEDATVTGPLEVSAGVASVRGGTAIVAKDHTAELQLARGGVVEVCQTSSLHVTAANSVSVAAPLLFALDRGALELKMTATERDGLMTPDLRFTPIGGGSLDLRVRTTSNGDTCVENRGDRAPVLEVTEQFGDGKYLLQPGQHVLFEHGSLREVVDHERSACGCPQVPVVSMAQSGVSAAPGAAIATAGHPAAQAEAQHPFPAAESQGLTEKAAAGSGVPQAPPGDVHAQVAATMAFEAPPERANGGIVQAPSSGAAGTPASGSGAAGGKAAGPALAPGGPVAGGAPAPVETAPAAAGVTSPATVAPDRPAGTRVVAGAKATPERVTPAPQSETVQAQTPPAPAPPGANDLAHGLGRFFKRLFGRGRHS